MSDDTPWDKVLRKTGLKKSELARILGCHRSTVTKGQARRPGNISPAHQKVLIEWARSNRVNITIDDLMPS